MRRGARRVLIVLAATALTAAVWAFAEGGRYMQHEEPLRHADAVFVLAGMQLERALEAADLYREGYAPLILLSPGLDEPGVSLVRKMGIYFPRPVDLVADALVRLGIP